MTYSWRIGTLFGIGVYVHWSFLLVPLLVYFNNLQTGTVALLPYALTLVLAVFGCVVLHEFGHALMARRFGIPTRDITLYPIGGIARLERMSERPWEEFWIAVAGPAVNVVIAAVLFLASWLFREPVNLAHGLLGLGQGNVLFVLAVLNLFLVVFNMLPAFPSDGGRVLRALLSLKLGQLRATEIAAWVGVAMAGLIGLFGLSQGSVMPVFVGLFLVFAGQQELAAVRYREALRTQAPLTVLPADEALLTVEPAEHEGGFSGCTWDPRARAWVLWRNGRPVHTYWME